MFLSAKPFHPSPYTLIPALPRKRPCVCCCSPLDIVIAVDESGSIGSGNWPMCVSFIRNLVNSLHTGPTAVQVSVIKFNHYANLQFPLNMHTCNKPDLLSAINGLTYGGGGTNIGAAINKMRLEGFSLSNGDRCHAANVGVVLTDGYSSSTATATAAQLAKDAGIELFAIGNYYLIICL